MFRAGSGLRERLRRGGPRRLSSAAQELWQRLGRGCGGAVEVLDGSRELADVGERRAVAQAVAAAARRGMLALRTERERVTVMNRVLDELVELDLLREAVELYGERTSANRHTYMVACRAFRQLGQLDAVRWTLTEMALHRSTVAYDDDAGYRESLQLDGAAAALYVQSLLELRPRTPVSRVLHEVELLGVPADKRVYHALMNALLHGRRASGDVLDAFRRMLSGGVAPDAVSYTFVISAVAHSKDYRTAFVTYEQMKRDGVLPDLGLYNLMMVIRAGAGDLREAEKVRALLELHRAHPSAVAPNESTLVSLLFAYATAGKLRTLVNLMPMLEERYGFVCPPSAYAGLLNAAVEHPELVRWLLARMREPVPSAFAELVVRKYGHARADPAARQLADELRTSILHENVSVREAAAYRHDARLVAAAFRSISNEEDLVFAETTFFPSSSPKEEIQGMAAVETVQVPSANSSELEDSPRLDLDEVGRKRFDGTLFWSSEACHAFLASCVRLGELPRARAWLERRLGMEQAAKDVVLVNMLVQAVLVGHGADAAEALFEDLQRRFGLRPSSRTFQIFVDAAADATDPKEAARWIARARDANVPLDVFHWTSLIRAYTRAGDLEKAAAAYREMRDRGILPNEVTHRVLLRGYARAGDLRTAMRYVDRLQAERLLDGGSAAEVVLASLRGPRARVEDAEAMLTRFAAVQQDAVPPAVVRETTLALRAAGLPERAHALLAILYSPLSTWSPSRSALLRSHSKKSAKNSGSLGRLHKKSGLRPTIELDEDVEEEVLNKEEGEEEEEEEEESNSGSSWLEDDSSLPPTSSRMASRYAAEVGMAFGPVLEGYAAKKAWDQVREVRTLAQRAGAVLPRAAVDLWVDFLFEQALESGTRPLAATVIRQMDRKERATAQARLSLRLAQAGFPKEALGTCRRAAEDGRLPPLELMRLLLDQHPRWVAPFRAILAKAVNTLRSKQGRSALRLVNPEFWKFLNQPLPPHLYHSMRNPSRPKPKKFSPENRTMNSYVLDPNL